MPQSLIDALNRLAAARHQRPVCEILARVARARFQVVTTRRRPYWLERD